MLLGRAVFASALGWLLTSSACSVADLTAGNSGSGGGSHSSGRDAESGSAGAGEIPDAGPAFVPTAMPVTVENLLNNRYLDVFNAGTFDGVQVLTWGYTGGLNQLWAFTAMGDGTYEIVSQISNKCLEVRGETIASGSYIQQFGCHGSDNQRWSVKRFDGYDLIVGKQSSRCLSSWAIEDGATVTILDC